MDGRAVARGAMERGGVGRARAALDRFWAAARVSPLACASLGMDASKHRPIRPPIRTRMEPPSPLQWVTAYYDQGR
jgi:hypothetical protein